MSRYGKQPYSGFYGVGAVGTYLMFWCAVAEGILLVAKELRRALREKATEERRRKKAEERARRIAEARPRSLNPPPSPAAVSAQWRKARGLQPAPEPKATQKPGDAAARPSEVSSVQQYCEADSRAASPNLLRSEADVRDVPPVPQNSAAPQPGAMPGARKGRKSRGSVEDALRFGSMLLDLEPTVDSSPVVRLNRAATRTVIVARNPGLKGWLHRHCPEVVYSTAMRYKQMATQAGRACGLPREVPLAWVVAGDAAQDAQHAKRTSADLRAARSVLLSLSADCRNKRRFVQNLDQALGTAHHSRRKIKRRRRPSPAAARRIDERMVASTQRLAHDKSERLGAAARERLIRGLLEITEELRRAAGRTSA